MNQDSQLRSRIRHAAGVFRIAAMLALAPASLPAQQPSDALVFRNVRVFDGVEVHERVTVVAIDGRIESVSPEAVVPEGATVIEGDGLTLLPGLIDAHTHFPTPPNLEQWLMFGVTTVMDMFSMPAMVARAREEQSATGSPGRPDVFSAGTLVTTEGGHGTEYGGPPLPTIGSADEAQQFVDERIAEGSDYIKIVYDFYGTPGNRVEDGTIWRGRLPSIDRATLGAVIRAAHARGKLAVVHALNLESARHALEEGADGLAHLFVDSLPDAKFVERAARSGLFVVPTLSLLEGYAGNVQRASLADPSVRAYLAPPLEAYLRLTGTMADQIQDPDERLLRLKETVRRLESAGIPVLAGTDAFGNPGTTAGLGLHEELAALVDAGLSPTAALAAATSIPAAIFRLGDRGRVEAGRRADLLLVEGDPTADIGATPHIVGIWKLGVRVDRETYRERFAGVRARYEALQAPGTTLVADFEGGGPRPTPTVGNLAPYDDRVWGGQSMARLTVVDGGAAGTERSLSITGTIVQNEPVAVAGANYWPFGPVDLSSKSEIVFFVKGTGSTGRLILNGPGLSRVPSGQTFTVGSEWTEVTIPLSGFRGVDLHRVATIVFAPDETPGDFTLQIDEVRIR